MAVRGHRQLAPFELTHGCRRVFPANFKNIVRGFSNDECRKFLVYVTAQSSLPATKKIEVRYACLGAVLVIDYLRFVTVVPMPGGGGRKDLNLTAYPVAHTCFARLDCAELTDKEELKRRLLYCLNEVTGFGIA